MVLRRLLARAGFRIALALLVLDLLFRVILFYPASIMWTLGYPEARASVFVHVLVGMLPLQLLWILLFVWILAPVDRWWRVRDAGRSDPTLLRRATEAAYRAPIRLTLVYAANWVVSALYSYAIARHVIDYRPLPGGAYIALGMTVASAGIGATAVSFTLVGWRLGPLTDELSVAARAEGVVIAARSMSLRSRVALIALTISGAPACWVTAQVCSEHFSSTSHTPGGDAFAVGLPLALLGSAVFALLCAAMFTVTVTRPVARMRGVVTDIIRRGDVSQVARLPVQQRDEIGALAETVNEMIDRLELVEQARSLIASHLEDMNLQLEAQVAQRTHLLEEANTQLRHESSERQRIEVELRLAQKLEALGRLASGVAHEINTPVQYVTDSLLFVRDAVQELQPLIGKYREVQVSVLGGAPSPVAAREAAALADEISVDYVLDNLMPAIDRSLVGLDRVTTIVRSMRTFARPDHAVADVDLNQTVLTTLEVARSEYTYIADVATELGDLPQLQAYPGELGQVVLNLVVNAAHAIGDVVGASGKRGKIIVKTWVDGSHACVSVADTGAGIPEDIHGSIFDPFFTTKEVGRGTGQGLAIVHGVVTHHRGDIRFITHVGEGTTFTVRLPLDPFAVSSVA